MARGTPDEEVYTPRVQAEDLPRKLVPHAEPQNIGPGIGAVANVIDQKYQADSATWASDQIAQLRTQAVTSLEQAKQNAPAGDQSGFTQSYLKSFDAMAKPTADASNNNPVASKMVQKGVQDLRDTLQMHSMEWSATQNVAYRADSFQNNLKSQLPLIEAHPELAGQVGSTLMDQLNSTGAEPAKRLEVARQMDGQISLAAANGLTRQDPRGALQALNDPTKAPPIFQPVLTGLNDAQREAVRAKANEHLGDVVYNALDSGNTRQAQIALSKNEDLMDPKTAHQLQSTINQMQDHALMMADKIQRDNSNALLKNAIKMSMDGSLTPQYIEQHHNTWEPEAYEYAYKLLNGKETTTDPHTFAPLLQSALGGQDVTQDAQAALYAGRLKQDDYTKIVEASESPRGNPVKNGASYIEQALKPSPMIYKPDASLDYANALSDYHDWLADNPKASSEDIASKARTISQNYAFVQAGKTMILGPVPMYLVGSRTAPDVLETARATKAAHDSGQMSDAEYIRQSALVMQWQDAQNAKAAGKPLTK